MILKLIVISKKTPKNQEERENWWCSWLTFLGSQVSLGLDHGVMLGPQGSVKLWGNTHESLVLEAPSFSLPAAPSPGLLTVCPETLALNMFYIIHQFLFSPSLSLSPSSLYRHLCLSFLFLDVFIFVLCNENESCRLEFEGSFLWGFFYCRGHTRWRGRYFVLFFGWLSFFFFFLFFSYFSCYYCSSSRYFILLLLFIIIIILILLLIIIILLILIILVILLLLLLFLLLFLSPYSIVLFYCLYEGWLLIIFIILYLFIRIYSYLFMCFLLFQK